MNAEEIKAKEKAYKEISDMWNLMKETGFKALSEEEWEILIETIIEKTTEDKTNLFRRYLYLALQEFYDSLK